jgi:hypothetical protein
MGFTVHDVTPELDKRLSERARNSGISKNRLVKEILAQAVGLPSEEGYSDDYREFCGIWSSTEREAFENTQTENRRIDPSDWQ